ncbi:MAG: chemotaxis response regulator protein-glutamate methylesterase [Candidatus Omnitrophica bacterium]|nr:chemotaxis response regulator protein-glutamate methylesterase [Candidatus Omnitrophota bacterium]
MIKVVTADDSPLLRNVLKDVLEQSGKIKVVGEARNGKESIELVKLLNPDVLILDCEMPVMNGLEALRIIMKECPLPVFMFSSLTFEGASVTLKALEHGAVDFLPKPTKGILGLEDIQVDLVNKIEQVVRRTRFKYKGLATTIHRPRTIFSKKITSLTHLSRIKIDLIAVGSSTGGVQTSLEIIKSLPAQTKPIVWVQHMPENFTKSFAERLDSAAKIKVKESVNGDLLENNTCYIARGGVQTRIKKSSRGCELSVGGGDKVSGHCPSCNALFDSIAPFFLSNVLGVILTGMGDDGARGLLRLHEQGAFVIGQCEDSCIVYGMPKAAYKLGAVDIELDVSQIADAIVRKGGGTG